MERGIGKRLVGMLGWQEGRKDVMRGLRTYSWRAVDSFSPV